MLWYLLISDKLGNLPWSRGSLKYLMIISGKKQGVQGRLGFAFCLVTVNDEHTRQS